MRESLLETKLSGKGRIKYGSHHKITRRQRGIRFGRWRSDLSTELGQSCARAKHAVRQYRRWRDRESDLDFPANRHLGKENQPIPGLDTTARALRDRTG